jgi:serine/threonine-protein kinase HipA
MTSFVNVYVQGKMAGVLERLSGERYRFRYEPAYSGAPVSLAMPIFQKVYEYETFPPFFEGLLPEGEMLEGLLRHDKIDRSDLFAQLTAVGADMVGAVTVAEVAP